MTASEETRVAVARRWFRLLGTDPIEVAGATIIADPAWPDVWDANFAYASPETRPEAVLAAIDLHLAHGAWRVVTVDALTPPAVEANLALAGYTPRDALIEMLAIEPPASRHPLPEIATRIVDDDATRDTLRALIRVDHAEGKRTGQLPEAVSEGLIATMLARTPPCRFDLIERDGEAVGYGLIACCPNGLGLIEYLFISPAHRGRGLMSAFIADAAARLRAAGCDAVFLDAHAGDTPKRLYAALGFRPVAISRTWARDARETPT